MIKQIKLNNHSFCFIGTFWYLCSYEVRQYFDLPPYFNKIFFTAHKRPGKNRVKLELVVHNMNNDYISIDGKVHGYWEMKTKDAIVKLLKKHGTLYVECDYQ